MRFSSALVGQHLSTVADTDTPSGGSGGMPTPVETKSTPNSSSANQTLTFTSMTAGETLLVFYSSDYYTLAGMPDVTSTAGTPGLVGSVDSGTNIGHMKCYVIPVTATGTCTVTIPAHIDCDIFGVALRFAETVTVDAFDSFHDVTRTTSHVAPGVTTTGADRLYVCAWFRDENGSAPPGGVGYIVPGGMTKLAEVGASVFSSLAVASEEIPTAGATGTRTASWFEARGYASFTVTLAASSSPGVLLPQSALYMTATSPVVKTSDSLTLPVLSYQTGRVSSDVTNTTTTLADMTGLSFPVLAAGVYIFDFTGSYTMSSTSSWITTALAGPASPTSVMVNHHFHIGTGLDTFHSGCSTAFGGTNTPAFFMTASAICAWRMYGSFEIGATAGTVSAQFARTSGAATATIKKNSYGWVRRIA